MILSIILYKIDLISIAIFNKKGNFMEIKYEITEEDYINLNLYHAKSLDIIKGIKCFKSIISYYVCIINISFKLKSLRF